MARLYSRRRGRSGSTRPITRKTSSWVKYAPEEIEDLIVRLAREGESPSSIGQTLRDRHSIPSVKAALGKSLTDILQRNNELVKVPEDMQSLLEKANRLRRYLERNRKDHHNRRSLSHVESKIYRLSKYYRKKGKLPSDWAYASVAASIE